MKFYDVFDKCIGENMSDEEIIEILKGQEKVLVVCFENDFNVSKLYAKLINLTSILRIIVIGTKSKTSFGKKIIFANNVKKKFFRGSEKVFFSIKTDIDEEVLKPIVDSLDYAKFFGTDIYVNYDGRDIMGNSYKVTPDLDIVLKAINFDNLYDRYSLIYDYICEELDNKFKNNSICQFENDRCIANRKHYNKDKIMGCCYSFKYNGIRFSDIKLCEHLKDKGCSVKCLGCKLFTCEYLRKHGIRFSLEKMSVARSIFSKKQREILRTTFFVPKGEVIEKLIQ